MEIVYYIIFYLMWLEVILFLLLTLPTPTGWKGKLTNFLSTNPHVHTIIKIQVALFLISLLFFIESYRTQSRYFQEKREIHNSGSMVPEIRKGWLSYTILKIQRNKYITFMFMYSCLGLSIYVLLLNYIYSKRHAFDLEKKDLQKGNERIKKYEEKNSEPLGSEIKKNQ